VFGGIGFSALSAYGGLTQASFFQELRMKVDSPEAENVMTGILFR
jgi:hypothetical protein